MKKRIPENINTLFITFATFNFELYMVGGCVRDLLLQKEPHDFDMTTNATPDEIVEIAKQMQWNYIITGEKYGTVTIFFNDDGIEITTFRFDHESSDGRRPDAVTFTNDIQQDLARRDFTINAIAYAPTVGIIDPFNGQIDLNKALIRAVGNPDIRFSEDYLRMLRAIRFATRLNFTLEIETKHAITANAPHAKQISKERLRKELAEIISVEHALCGITLLTETQLWEHIFPEISMNISALRHISNFPQVEQWRWLAISLALCKNDEEVNFIFNQLTLGQKHEQWIGKLYQCLHAINRANTMVEMKASLASLSDEERQDFIRLLNILKIKNHEVERIINEHHALRIDELAISGHDLLALGLKDQAVGAALIAAQTHIHTFPNQNTKTAILTYLQKEWHYE